MSKDSFVNMMATRIKRVADNTKDIEEPETSLQIFLDGSEPIYEDYGQFAGGMCTLVYVVNEQVYEFILSPEDTIMEAITYPISVSRFHKTNGVPNNELLS